MKLWKDSFINMKRTFLVLLFCKSCWKMNYISKTIDVFFKNRKLLIVSETEWRHQFLSVNFQLCWKYENERLWNGYFRKIKLYFTLSGSVIRTVRFLIHPQVYVVHLKTSQGPVTCIIFASFKGENILTKYSWNFHINVILVYEGFSFRITLYHVLVYVMLIVTINCFYKTENPIWCIIMRYY